MTNITRVTKVTKGIRVTKGKILTDVTKSANATDSHHLSCCHMESWRGLQQVQDNIKYCIRMLESVLQKQQFVVLGELIRLTTYLGLKRCV